MLKINKTTNLSGQVLIEVPGTEGNVKESKPAAYLNATVHEDGNININKTIQNAELFNANKETVLADMQSFEDYVYAIPVTEKSAVK